MSFDIAKSKIVEVLEELGLKRNPINKKIADDYHNKYYSFNTIELIQSMDTQIGNYIFDIDIAIDVNSNEAVDKAQTFFDLLVKRVSGIDIFLSYNKNPILKQMDKNPNKLIGNINFIIDNYYC
jgi:hypothetical protein